MEQILIAPTKFTISATDKFLSDCEFIFSLVGKYKPDALVNLSNIKSINLINVLIIYKVLSFAGENRCLINSRLRINDYIMVEFIKYGLYPLLLSYVENAKGVDAQYKHLFVRQGADFIIAPQALLRNDSYSHETIRNIYLPAIEKYYSSNPKVALMILTCLSEILLNFWEHAVDDDKTVIMAYGTRDRIEIACADNGKGILSTLSDAYPSIKNKKSLLMSCLKKGITSKKSSNHMGFGLWLVNEIAVRTGGRLHIFSEGGHIHSEHSRIKYTESGNWKGAIIYLDIPLNNPITISDIESENHSKSAHNIKINWT
jgi:hypothetical protein